jgi:hypothetical protein
MSQVVLNAERGPVTAPEQLKEWVISHPVQVKRYIFVADLSDRLAELAADWTAAAVVNPYKEVGEFVRFMMVGRLRRTFRAGSVI